MSLSSNQAFADGSESLVDKAYQALEEQIVTATLAPGAVLSESALSVALGIGRTPVREALHRLQREGLIVILPRRGILVAQLDIRAQLQMLEVRRELERLMADKAAERASDDQRVAFEHIASTMLASADASDDLRFIRLDGEFNELLIRAANNPFLASSIGLMAGLSRRFWFMHNRREPDIRISAECHAAVARAVAAGDAGRAMAASDELMDYVVLITRRALDW